MPAPLQLCRKDLPEYFPRGNGSVRHGSLLMFSAAQLQLANGIFSPPNDQCAAYSVLQIARVVAWTSFYLLRFFNQLLTRRESMKNNDVKRVEGGTGAAACKIDVQANRRARKWSRRELLGRLLWELVYPLFAISPRPMWALRCALLRIFGANIGRKVHIHPSVRITIPWNLSVGDESAIGDRAIIYALGRITIGERATISQGAHLCAGSHDYRDPAMPLLKTPINVGNGAWVCADAFIGPQVTIGNGAIVGARAVVTKDVGEYQIVAGNPAKVISNRDGAINGDP